MNNKKIIIFFLIIFLITLIIISFKYIRIYNIKIKPTNYKLDSYNKLVNENKKLNAKIDKEEKKYINNQEAIKSNKEKREELEKVIYEHEEKVKGKIIYLTFDDGPSIYTDEILDILDKYNIKATFFVVCSKDLPEYSKKYIENGHTIGLHSCSHKYSDIYSSEESYFNDLNKLSDIIEESSGYKSKYVRFPGGSSNTVSKFNKGIITRLSNLLNDKGYKYYDWNIDSNDAGGANSEQIYSNVIGALKNNDRDISMVLMHDTKLATKEALDAIIKKALEMGYTFGNINDYTPEVHHYINN